MLYMASKLVALRIPEDLLSKIDAQGKRSPVIIAILEAHYASPFVKPAKVASIRAQTEKPVAQPETSASAATGHSFPPSVIAALKAQVTTPEHLGWSHDPKTCRVYRCGMCASIKS